MSQPTTPGPRPDYPDGAASAPAGGDAGRTQGEARPEGTTWAHGDGSRPVGGGYGAAPTGQPYGPPSPPGHQGDHRGWGAPVGPAVPAAPEPSGPGQPPRSGGLGRLGQLLAVALLAAALASGGTWALTRTANQPTVDESARTVEQADPNAPNWTTTAKVVTPSVVSIRVAAGSSGGEGSGVILDTKGHIVTNNHVVAAGGSGGQITVALSDRRVYDAEVTGADPDTDLAVLQLKNPPSDLRPIALGDDTKLTVGDPVMAIGNPLGLSGTVTTGIVSALNRPVTTRGDAASGSGTTVVTNAIQTSAAINPGNSGGALVNASGQLVGINSSIASLSQGSGNIGIGFAIPVNEVKSVTQQLLSTGRARHAQLGVQVRDVVAADGPDRRAAAGIAAITVPGGPAELAGLRVGDAVVAVDGEPVDGAASLQAQIRERQVGDQVTLTVLRDGARQELRVTLGERS